MGYHRRRMSIAIFDLDGTITRHDTLFPLVLRWLARRPWRLARLLLVLPAALRFVFDRDRAALKQSLLRATMRDGALAVFTEPATSLSTNRLLTIVMVAPADVAMKERRIPPKMPDTIFTFPSQPTLA